MKRVSQELERDDVGPWFETLEEMGEFVGIRFGFLGRGSDEPEWHFVSHAERDGIGGFVQLLQGRGAELKVVPETNYRKRAGVKTWWYSMPGFCRSRKPKEWKFSGKGQPSQSDQPPPAVSWHLFSEEETKRICEASRQQSVSVNSFLLKHLDTVIRRDLSVPSAPVSWMIPVNLRGGNQSGSSQGNQTGYVTARITGNGTIEEVHAGVHRNLDLGQHWLTRSLYSTGRWMSSGLKKKLIKMNRVMAEPYLGAFSNLGRWDDEVFWNGVGLSGSWLFCPPVLRCQMIGAGCVTYQNRLSLTIQIHPELSTDPQLIGSWITSWVELIGLDL